MFTLYFNSIFIRGMNAPVKRTGLINQPLDCVMTKADKGFIPLSLLPGAFMPRQQRDYAKTPFCHFLFILFYFSVYDDCLFCMCFLYLAHKTTTAN